ncbi:MAG TPA: hypothetical protein VGA42_05080 [Gemmatimonadales bacterium]
MAAEEILAKGLGRGFGHRVAELLDASLHDPFLAIITPDPEPARVTSVLRQVEKYPEEIAQLDRLARRPRAKLQDVVWRIAGQRPRIEAKTRCKTGDCPEPPRAALMLPASLSGQTPRRLFRLADTTLLGRA